MLNSDATWRQRKRAWLQLTESARGWGPGTADVVFLPRCWVSSNPAASDAIFANASTFKVEMDDARKILVDSTPRSLVILDELGRGTATHDGLSIAFSVLSVRKSLRELR